MIAGTVHTPWAKEQPPSEAELRHRLISEGLDPRTWSAASGDREPVHSHEFPMTVYCVEGSAWVTIVDDHNRTIELEPGDRLDIPPGVRHAAMAGLDGATCLEALHKS
jgi:quercetin dioxygenase-like cupin family protein